MELAPRLIDVAAPKRPRGVVLVLHGGAARRGETAVSPTQLSVVRMIPIARRIRRAGHGELAVFRLLNARRGWIDGHTPVRDAHWALDRIAERYGEPLPTCLVGHSLGGRAAILTANRPEVCSAAALAPWVYPTEVPDGLHGERILIVHGSADRVARPDRSAALARELGKVARVGYVTISGGSHALLRQARRVDGLAAEFAAVTLLGAPSRGTLARLQAGEAWVTV